MSGDITWGDVFSSRVVSMDSYGEISIEPGEYADAEQRSIAGIVAYLLANKRIFLLELRYTRLRDEIRKHYNCDRTASLWKAFQEQRRRCLITGLDEYGEQIIDVIDEMADIEKPFGYPSDRLIHLFHVANYIEETKKLSLLVHREHPLLDPPAGYIYLVRSLTEKVYWKIGRAIDPDDRVERFSIEIPFDVECEHIIPAHNVNQAESRLHKKYKHARYRGEWFDLSPIEVAEIRAITWL